MTQSKTTSRAFLGPREVEQRYDISPATRLRWEKNKRLPPRDFFVGGVPEGWHVGTLDLADRGELVA